MSEIAIRPAKTADLVAVAAIYAQAVRTSIATFDEQEPPMAYWQARLDSRDIGDHFLVACASENGTEDQVHLVVAVVAQPNPASNALHRKVGFAEVGTLDEVGFKFGAYVSTTWFQQRLD